MTIALIFVALHFILFVQVTSLDWDFGAWLDLEELEHGRMLQNSSDFVASALCNQALDFTLSGPNQEEFQWDCSCKEATNALDGSSGSVHLECVSSCGNFCNRRNDVCLIPGFIQGFDANGINYFFSQTYQYSKGRHEYVERKVFFSGDGSPLTCQYAIDHQLCQSCEITPCVSGGAPIELVCTNFPEGLVFDFCADPTPSVDVGVFEFLNPLDFTICSPATSSDESQPAMEATRPDSAPGATTPNPQPGTIPESDFTPGTTNSQPGISSGTPGPQNGAPPGSTNQQSSAIPESSNPQSGTITNTQTSNIPGSSSSQPDSIQATPLRPGSIPSTARPGSVGGETFPQGTRVDEIAPPMQQSGIPNESSGCQPVQFFVSLYCILLYWFL